MHSFTYLDDEVVNYAVLFLLLHIDWVLHNDHFCEINNVIGKEELKGKREKEEVTRRHATLWDPEPVE